MSEPFPSDWLDKVFALAIVSGLIGDVAPGKCDTVGKSGMFCSPAAVIFFLGVFVGGILSSVKKESLALWLRALPYFGESGLSSVPALLRLSLELLNIIIPLRCFCKPCHTVTRDIAQVYP